MTPLVVVKYVDRKESLVAQNFRVLSRRRNVGGTARDRPSDWPFRSTEEAYWKNAQTANSLEIVQPPARRAR